MLTDILVSCLLLQVRYTLRLNDRYIRTIIEIFNIIPWIYYRNSVSDFKSLSMQRKYMLHSPCSHSPEETQHVYIVGRNLLKLYYMCNPFNTSVAPMEIILKR
jgi:hypothetical protein